MANAITTYNSVPSTFVVNKYDDIDGSVANQITPRGRFCFRDTNGRMTLPRDLTEAQKAVYPVDHAKPINPPPYFDGVGLNGQLPNAFSDGSFNASQDTFSVDPNQSYISNWPVGYRIYEVPPLLYNLPVVSGNRVLVYDEGTFTMGSGNYVGVPTDYNYASLVYVDYTSGNEGKITASGSVAGNTVVGVVVGKDIFGANSITIKTKGTDALIS